MNTLAQPNRPSTSETFNLHSIFAVLGLSNFDPNFDIKGHALQLDKNFPSIRQNLASLTQVGSSAQIPASGGVASAQGTIELDKTQKSSAPVSQITIQPGDSLSKIAARYPQLGDTLEDRIQALQEFNDIENRHVIYAGASLRIPGVDLAPEDVQPVEAAVINAPKQSVPSADFQQNTVGKPPASPRVINTSFSTVSFSTLPQGSDRLDPRNAVLHPGVMEKYNSDAYIGGHSFRDMVDHAMGEAQANGLQPEWFVNQLYQESGFNPNAVSSAGAVAVSQFMPATAEQYGVSPQDLMNDPMMAISMSADLMGNLTDKYDGDQKLAMVAYNAGDGSKDWKKNPILNVQHHLGTDDISGDDWVSYMDSKHDRRNDKKTYPNGWHNETLGYVEKITGSGWSPQVNEQLAKLQGQSMNTNSLIADAGNRSTSIAIPSVT